MTYTDGKAKSPYSNVTNQNILHTCYTFKYIPTFCGPPIHYQEVSFIKNDMLTKNEIDNQFNI